MGIGDKQVPTSWRTVRIFISSTFRDMHAERDHLVRVVFPELKERCHKRHVQLIDVDLRWGVTEEQAESGGALDICLDEIDSCRPYFLGLLGHRYGYIPPGHDNSITADEVYHGVLHNNLPHQLIDLRPFVEGILEGRTLFKEQVNCLLRCYQWDPEKRKYLLQQTITPEDEKTLRSIFDVYSIYQKDRSFFFFRSESLTREMDVSNLEDYFEADEALRAKLVSLKQEIINAGLPYFEYDDLETFGQQVLETLWDRIDAEFPEKREDIERDWLKEEAEFHELFIADRTRWFVGRSDILRRMHTIVEDESDPRLMVITGEPGCGKSALIARFTEEVSHNHPDWLILSHFVGASPSSTSLRRTLRRLCAQLNRVLGAAEEVPEEYKELAQLFPELLQRASETRRVLLVIDALNQFERTDNAHTMRWLSQKLPPNTKTVVSTLAGEALDALKARRMEPQFEELSGLTRSEIKEFATSYLSEIRKDFPTPQIKDAFYDKIKAGHPLYILVALEELRVFPVYEEVGKRVASLPDTVPDLFDQVLERIEGDFSRPLVRDFMSLIACGRQGMTGEELQVILKEYALVIETDRPAAKLPAMLLARLRRSFSAYLFERSGVIDFFHGQLKEAVGKRYLADESDRDKVHQIIAEYFDKRWAEPYPRALDELPYQLTNAEEWDELVTTLSDLSFIETKCMADMLFDLIADCDLGIERHDLPSVKQIRQALALELTSLTARPALSAQSIYNRLVWFDPLEPQLRQRLEAAEDWLDRRGPWIRTQSPLPGTQNGGAALIPFNIESSIQSLSPDKKTLAVASLEGELEIYDLSSGEQLSSRHLDFTSILAVALHEDGESVAFMSADGTVRSELSDAYLKGRRGERLLGYHPAHGVLAVREDSALVAWHPDGSEPAVLAADLPAPLVVLRVTLDGQSVLYVAGYRQQVVGVARWTGEGWENKTLPYAGPPVVDADLDAETDNILLASMNRSLQVIDTRSGEVVTQLSYEARGDVILRGAPGKSAFGLGDSLGWAFLATRDGYIGCWNWSQNELTRLDDWRSFGEASNLVLFIPFPPADLFISTEREGRTISRKSQQPTGTRAKPISECFITASRKVVSASELGNSVEWFSAEGLKPLFKKTLQRPTAIGPCGDTDTTVIGDHQGRVWIEPPDAKVDAESIYQAFAEPVVSAFCAGDGTILAVGRSGKILHIDPGADEVRTLRDGRGFQTQHKILPAGDEGLFWSLHRREIGERASVVSLVRRTGEEQITLELSDFRRDLAVSEDGASLCVTGESVLILAEQHGEWTALYRRDTPAKYATFLGEGDLLAVVLTEEPWLEVWRMTEGLPTVAAVHLPGKASSLSARGDRVVLGFFSGDLMSLRLRGRIS